MIHPETQKKQPQKKQEQEQGQGHCHHQRKGRHVLDLFGCRQHGCLKTGEEVRTLSELFMDFEAEAASAFSMHCDSDHGEATAAPAARGAGREPRSLNVCHTRVTHGRSAGDAMERGV